MTPNKVVIAGSGSWGSALACAASRAGNDTHILCRSEQTVDEINNHKTNSFYLNDVKLEHNIRATTNKRILSDAEIIIFAIPAQALRQYLKSLIPQISTNTLLVSAAKGIELANKCPMSVVMTDTFSENQYAILSGPSFASEVAISLPTAVTLASNCSSVSKFICYKLSSKYFRCYSSSDVIGVEFCGALKNVYALGAGICDGLNLGHNAKAAFITRSMAEMARIIGSISPNSDQSLQGLSGIGDLQLTCATGMSRNYTFGLDLIRSPDFRTKQLCEGFTTLEAMRKIVQARGIIAPILISLFNVIYLKQDVENEINLLLSRPLNSDV